MTRATRLAGLLREGVGINLPVRLRLWDGSETGPRDGPVLVIRNRRALRRLLWAPGELGLARAYVTGDIDVEGDLAGHRDETAGLGRQVTRTLDGGGRALGFR